MNEKLTYQGPYALVVVEGHRFKRGVATDIPAELKTRLLAGQSKLPARVKPDFVSPVQEKPKPVARVVV
jgi:hypothetical protein